MQASRLLSILMLLQTRGRLSARTLAAEFEVSERTIHRDIDQLSAAGVPVYAERGRAGGFQLMDGYRTTLTGLTQSEAETLFLAGLPGPAAQLGLSDHLQAARLKLMAALPASTAPSAERIASRFHLDPAGWFRTPDPLPALQPVAQAVWSGVMLDLTYRPAGEDARTRRIGPLGLVLKGGVWYLVAQAGKRTLTYRVASIEAAEASEAPFARPEGFDLAAHWARSSRDYELAYYRGQAQVRLSPRGMRLLAPLGPHVVAAAKETAGPPDADGWVTCSLPIESLDDGVRELLRLGAEAEVVGPPALRARVVATLSEIGARYG
jgi:predicted DNA-binding transcriptional regulator YafY